MDLPQKGFELRHTTMPARKVTTPHGDAIVASRWMRDRYYLVTSGSYRVLCWMFPKHVGEFEKISLSTYRHVFVPAPMPITVMRTLEHVCAKWQEQWEERRQNDQLIGDHSPVGTVQPENLTLSQLIERYQTARTGELAPATMQRDFHYLNRWVKEMGGDLLIQDIAEENIVSARTHIASKLMISTVNCMYASLRTVMRWATSRGWMTDHAYRGIRNLRSIGDEKEVAWWTTADVETALRCAKEVDADLHRNPDKDIPGTATLLVALGCLVGLRYEEIIMLRWCDVNLDAVNAVGAPAPVLHIVAHDGWVPKGKRSRTVPIHDRLIGILRTFHRETGYYILRPHALYKKPKTGTKRVYRYDPKKIWNRVIKKVIAAGVKRITPHGMRHSFASNLLMGGALDGMVFRWLGHADASQLHERYGHLLAYHGDINKMRFDTDPHSESVLEKK